MFQGKFVRIEAIDEGVRELCFDRNGESINKLDAAAVAEVFEAGSLLAADSTVRGVLISSAKDVFIVGADINEFGAQFKWTESRLAEHTRNLNRSFIAIERWPFPSVVAINGYALGGGLEAALAADYRVMSSSAQIGLPEVKLGLFPGLGGTVRLPRIAGPQVAIEWISSGSSAKAEVAKGAGVVDEIAPPARLREAALSLLQKAMDGQLDWRARRVSKDSPLPQEPAQIKQLFVTAREMVAKKSAKHQPAALAALDLMAQTVFLQGEAALVLEADAFSAIAHTQAAASLIQIFLNEQLLKKKYKEHARSAKPPKRAAVLGAGIMGGGIAYTSALRGTPVQLKDVQASQLELGMAEARKLLVKQVQNGRIKQAQADGVLASITPQLNYNGFEQLDLVVEAVVEKLEVKHAVLGEVEKLVRSDAIIASNTSSLRIDDLATGLQRPENFVGMHFFNPVPLMPLVEVIRGAKTSDVAASTVVGYGVAMGKTPIVVKDGPGFLVNRILTPYMLAASRLIAEGADFVAVDKAMEAFGWPMGPNYLNDVIGMDTAQHVSAVIGAGYPNRMRMSWTDSVSLMVERKRLGQKSALGFYRYEVDAHGKMQKSVAPDSHALLASTQRGTKRDFSSQQIVERMMLPMLIEAVHALEDRQVDSAAELDMALLLGVGFPQYLGGALKYLDWLGCEKVIELCEKYTELGPMYEPTPKMREMARDRGRFYET